ncbi:MAG: MBOAT family O-acyltransferase [Elusimicrobiota bacterium]
MTFVSFRFFAFLAAAAGIYALLSPARRRPFLLAVSCFFYAAWSPAHLALLLAAAGVSYWAGLRIAAAGTEKKMERTAAVAILVLLASLSLFKYSGRNWLVPVGISYYTFKLISYVVDVYWGKIPPERDFVSFAAYVAFFPQILSGPIQRAVDFLPQLSRAGAASPENIGEGLRLILFGLFQKVVVADSLALIVDQIYRSPGAHHGWPLLFAIDCFFLQLYADFSGLTDIAIGAALLFGIRSPQNFDAPFYAPNLKEFWLRWHMTLTTWLLDYVFTPLRMLLRYQGLLGLGASIFLTMLAIGLWHGASANFLIYGAASGVCLVISIMSLPARDRFFNKHPLLSSLRKFTAPLGTFHVMALSLVFFRSATVSDALSVFRNLAMPSAADPSLTASFRPDAVYLLIAAVLVMEAVHIYRKSEAFRSLPRVVSLACDAALLFFLLISSGPPSKQFIYFRF